MHYVLSGNGERTIVFIHGFGGSSALWQGQVKDFGARARILTVDLPGHGQTPWAGEGLDVMAVGLCDAMDKVGVRQADIVASSFGGLVALKLFEKFPQCVRSVSFVGSTPRFVPDQDFPAGLTVEAIRKLSDQFEGDVGKVLDMFFRSLFTVAERESDEYRKLKDLRRDMPVPSREALQGFLKMLEGEDLREILWRMDVPVQLINGDSDPLCPLPVVQAIQQKMSQARVDILTGVGHLPFLTKPGEFYQMLSEFLGL